MENLTFDEMLDQLMEEEADDMGLMEESTEEDADLMEEETDPMGDDSSMDTDDETDIALEGDDEDDDEDDLDLDDLEDDDDDEDDEDEDDDDEDEDDELGEMEDDISGLSDEDLRRLEKDLKCDGGSCEDEEEVRLTPDEEIRADDMMQIAGAASLIRSEMNAEEKAELLESTEDIRYGMLEGFFSESFLVDLADSVAPADMDEMMTEAKIYNKTTVRMSKEARLAQLFAIAVNSSARAHNDPDYARYKKACKIKRAYAKKLRVKYKSEATKRMRVLFARLKSSKSPILKNLGKKVEK